MSVPIIGYAHPSHPAHALQQQPRAPPARSTGVEYNARARLLVYRSPIGDQLPKIERLPGTVAVVSAGAADQPVVSTVCACVLLLLWAANQLLPLWAVNQLMCRWARPASFVRQCGHCGFTCFTCGLP